uniref:Uncharacterized protein n=1 Tax=Sphaerodactylus townsendi TaxID=933632 RepID=A0ACB8G295_9SAUR
MKHFYQLHFPSPGSKGMKKSNGTQNTGKPIDPRQYGSTATATINTSFQTKVLQISEVLNCKTVHVRNPHGFISSLVFWVFSGCFLHHRSLLQQSLFLWAVIACIHSGTYYLYTSRLDYCNSLYAGLPLTVILKLKIKATYKVLPRTKKSCQNGL